MEEGTNSFHDALDDARERIEQNIKIATNDPIVRGGFTQVPNFILEDENLSIGVKMAYAMLLRYAWNDDKCFPGQERMAKQMGLTKGRVSQFMKELQGHGLLDVKRRGLGKTNLYTVRYQVKNKKNVENSLGTTDI